MQLVRRRDTPAEVRLRSLLHARGLRFRVDRAPEPRLRRKADVVFTRARVAVFVDGCFWHACPEHATWPKANADWWREKIERNRARDEETNSLLTAAGWHVMRFWAHEDMEDAARKVADAAKRPAPGSRKRAPS